MIYVNAFVHPSIYLLSENDLMVWLIGLVFFEQKIQTYELTRLLKLRLLLVDNFPILEVFQLGPNESTPIARIDMLEVSHCPQFTVIFDDQTWPEIRSGWHEEPRNISTIKEIGRERNKNIITTDANVKETQSVRRDNAYASLCHSSATLRWFHSKVLLT